MYFQFVFQTRSSTDIFESHGNKLKNMEFFAADEIEVMRENLEEAVDKR